VRPVSPGAFDVVTLAVGAVGYQLGRSRGLLWQASGLLTLAGGGLCATVLSRPLGAMFGAGVLGRFVAWLVVYAAVAICLYVLTLKFRQRIRELEYDELDRRFGGLAGVLKGLAVFGLVVVIAAALSPRIAGAVKASVSGQALRALVHELRPLLPEKVHDGFGPWLDAVDGPPPPAQPAPTRWPDAEPPPGAPPAPASAPTTAAPPAPAAAPVPSAPTPVERHEPPLDDGTLAAPPPPRPRTTAPAAPDPFDPANAPADPLAPPR
jgi:hypothetical protein